MAFERRRERNKNKKRRVSQSMIQMEREKLLPRVKNQMKHSVARKNAEGEENSKK